MHLLRVPSTPSSQSYRRIRRSSGNILNFEHLDELDAVDRLVCEYAREVTLNWNRVRDAMFDRLHEHFSDAQIVELTWRIALCGAFNRFNDVLQINIEDGVDVIDAATAVKV